MIHSLRQSFLHFLLQESTVPDTFAAITSALKQVPGFTLHLHPCVPGSSDLESYLKLKIMIQVVILLSFAARELLQMVKLICLIGVSFFQLGLRLK